MLLGLLLHHRDLGLVLLFEGAPPAKKLTRKKLANKLLLIERAAPAKSWLNVSTKKTFFYFLLKTIC